MSVSTHFEAWLVSKRPISDAISECDVACVQTAYLKNGACLYLLTLKRGLCPNGLSQMLSLNVMWHVSKRRIPKTVHVCTRFRDTPTGAAVRESVETRKAKRQETSRFHNRTD